MKFFSDQYLSYADILPPHEVSFSADYQIPSSSSSSSPLLFRFEILRSLILQARARIEVSVLNLLRILNSPDPAISDLSLVL